MSDTILQLNGLSKGFGGVQVIDDCSFDVPRGARMALIGPNGAGKTTIFNLMSGVYTPDAGRVIFDGEDITDIAPRMRVRRGLARSFQNIRLMPHLSVVENIMLGQHARVQSPLDMVTSLVGRSRWRQEAEALLDDMNMDSFPGEVVATLPYGVRKKIEVVRALASNPKMLMLDEPAAGLNPSETAELRDFLVQISETGVTILIVEHDMSLVRSLCDRAVVLNFGRLIYDGSTKEVQRDPQVLEAYLGSRHADESLKNREKGAAHA